MWNGWFLWHERGKLLLSWLLAGSGLTGRLRPWREAIAEIVGAQRRAWGCCIHSGGGLDDGAALLRKPRLDQHGFGDHRCLSEPVGTQRRPGEGVARGRGIRLEWVGAPWRGRTEGTVVIKLWFSFLWHLLVRGGGVFVSGGRTRGLRGGVLLHAALPGSPWTLNLTAVCAAPGPLVHPTGGHNSFHGGLPTHKWTL